MWIRIGWDKVKGFLELLVLGQEIHLQGLEKSLVLGTLELWLLPSFLEHILSLIKAIALDQANNSIKLHGVPLYLRQILVLLELSLDPLSKLLPVKRTNNLFENGSIKIVDLTERTNIKLNQDIVLDGLGELKPTGVSLRLIADVRVLVHQVAEEVHLLYLESYLVVLVGVVHL